MYQKKPVVYQESEGLKSSVEGRYVVNGNRVSFALGDFDRSKTLVIDPLPPIYYSTFLGGSDVEIATAVKADQFGNAYVTGTTYSTNFPVTSGANPADRDIFITKFNASGTALYYSFLLGGSGFEGGESIAIDGSGSVYVTGYSSSTDFPLSWIAYDQSYNGGTTDNFIVKFNSNGSINYSTYVGGSGTDYAYRIAIDSEGSAYITGSTKSSNYPTTVGAYDQTLGNTQDAYVTKINPGGYALTYSTFLGGSGAFEAGYGLAVDSLGRAYVAGSAHGGGLFPVTAGSYSTANNTQLPDCFVTKFNSAGTAVVYSTLFGGDSQESLRSLAIDSGGNAYITGYTSSSNYPKTLWAFDTFYNSSLNAAFVTKVNNGGASLGYSTYLEGNDGLTEGRSIVVNSSGHVTLAGYTTSASFPVGPNAFDITHNGSLDVFLVKMPTTAFSGLTTSTFLGGTGYDDVSGLAVSSTGFAYIVGRTTSTDYPTTAGAWDTTHNGNSDAFVTRYEADYLP